ncbi:MAG: hypothetical protein LBE80_03950 [Deltaproteobacteria bacterium]|nr:hypothetical protein [Deltaproteobacteria bacterium]
MPMVTLMVLLMANALRAQQAPAFTRPDENGNYFGNELPNLRAVTLKTTWVHPKNPKVEVELDLSYPTSTGNNTLDRYFRSQLDKEYELMISYANPDDEFCQETLCIGYLDRHFEAYAPSPGIISIAYLSYQAVQGAGTGSPFVESSTYDLKSGRKLTLDDLFVDPKKSIPRLWPMIVQGWCEHENNDPKIIPSFYSNDLSQGPTVCAKAEGLALPDRLKSGSYSFENLGFAFLTPRGLSLKLPGMMSWGPASAVYVLHIDRERLLKIGAKPQIWSIKTTTKP